MCQLILKVILMLCLLKVYRSSAVPSAPIVIIDIEQNRTSIEGTEETDWNGGTYYSFRGISYAKPPIGDLRFKDPQPLDFLPDHIDGRYDGYECPSVDATNASENCLILNVYTKKLNPVIPLPVIFNIHPGGLYMGSSLTKRYGPQYLLTKDVVLVTFNYRLGALGFLNLGTKDIPGNAGFKDQVLALRWVQRYIQHFGGNSADITLMGYSAGGQSVSLHLASPMSKGLFNKAIIMSGVFPPQTILPRQEQIELAIRQSQRLNCTIENTATPEAILNCLNDFSGSEIAGTLGSMFVFGNNPIYLWRPMIERDFGQERFLTEDFYTLIRRGEFQRVPLLIGFTNGEFCNEAGDILSNEMLKRQFHEEFLELAPDILMFEEQANGSLLSEAISEHYTGSKHQKNWNFDQICNIISDAIIRFGSHRLGSLAAKFVSVYAYLFAYKGAYTHSEYDGSEGRAVHVDDLDYLIRGPNHYVDRHENDAKMVESYVDFIWEFVTNGKIIKNSQSFPQSHTLINETFVEKSGSNFAEAAFWEHLFP